MEEFKQVIRELTDLFRELSALGGVKLDAARMNNTATLETCMTREQALSMKLKGLEQKRERVQASLGYGGKRFREILETDGAKDDLEMAALFESLSREVQMFREVNDDVNRIVGVNLREIRKELDRRDIKTYGASGTKNEREYESSQKNFIV